MSIKGLEPLQPISPFYPEFIPTGQQSGALISKSVVYTESVLSVGSGQAQVSQVMGIPALANVSFFNVQLLDPQSSCLPAAISVKISDTGYDQPSDTMSWYFNWNGLLATERPNVVCTVFYYL
jgi:hypothetical protein